MAYLGSTSSALRSQRFRLVELLALPEHVTDVAGIERLRWLEFGGLGEGGKRLIEAALPHERRREAVIRGRVPLVSPDEAPEHGLRGGELASCEGDVADVRARLSACDRS
jgi:hypothetical protein